MKMKPINMDLQQCGITPVIDAVQGDVWSRDLEIHLFSSEKPYYIPDNTAVIIRYRKADRTGGEYDTLPDGTPAWKVRGNTLTMTLSDQALTFPGKVLLTVSLIRKEKQLNSFPIELCVHPNAHTDCTASEDYFNISGFLTAPWNAAQGQYLRISAVNAEGRVTEVEAADPPEYFSGSNTSIHLEENESGVLIRVENGDGSISSVQLRHGKDGTDGQDGANGKDGYTPIKGVDYFDGIDGKDGRDGQPGIDGSPGMDGYTPVKGVDYWTEADRESMVQDVIAAMGTPVFGSVDADNNIILSGNLVNGIYMLKYEDAEGEQTEIGTVVIGTASPEPVLVNQIPISTDTDDSVYNGKGYKEGTRISSSSGSISANEAVDLTGFIPVKMGDVIRMKDVVFVWATVGSVGGLHYYSPDKTTKLISYNNSLYPSGLDENLSCIYDDTGNLVQFTVTNYGGLNNPAYLRVCASSITDESIITVNQEIV